MEPALAVLGASAILAGLALARLRRRVAIISVTGPSMEPALSHGDRVLVLRAGLRAVRAGQIVVVEAPDFERGEWTGRPARNNLGRDWLIKRAAAIPGDPLPDGMSPAIMAGARVPDGMLVILGDNAKMSMDSRHLGYVPGDRLLGVVVRALPRNAPRSVLSVQSATRIRR